MKPSQILRQTQLEQCFEDYQATPRSACALGAIALGFGWKGYYTKTGRLRKAIGDIESILEGIGLDYKTQETIIDLNDEKVKSFEEIAAWLEKRGL